MKLYYSKTILAILVLASCGRPQSNEQSTGDSLQTRGRDSLQALITVKAISPWVVPLAVPLNDPAFMIILASGNHQIPVSHKAPAEKGSVNFIADTTELRYASSMESKNACGNETIYYLPGSTTSVSSNDVFVVDRLNLGTFNIGGGRILKLGSMKPQYRMDNNTCTSSRLLFFYDDQFLYLVDVNDADENESVHGRGDRAASLINQPDNLTLECTSYENMYEMQWFIPHGRATLRLIFEDGHVKCSEYQEKLTEDPSGAGNQDALQTVECVFVDYSIGDCGHVEFSCGDFGNADSRKLSEADRQLWSALSVSGPDGEAGNPEYIGKTFTIQYRTIQGEICTDPSQPQVGDVQELVSFKLTIVN